MPSPSLYSNRRLFCHDEGTRNLNLSARLRSFNNNKKCHQLFFNLLNPLSLGDLTSVAISTIQHVTRKQTKLTKLNTAVPSISESGYLLLYSDLGLDKEMNYCFHSCLFVVTLYTDTYELL